MRFIFLPVLLLFPVALGFSPPLPPLTFSGSRRSSTGTTTTCQATTRRNFLISTRTPTSFVAVATTVAIIQQQQQPASAEATDPLEAFGQQLQQQSAQLLLPQPTTQPPTQQTPSPPAQNIPDNASSDLQKALESAQKKKQVDPRTHG